MILKTLSMLVYTGKKVLPVSAILARPEVAALIEDLGLEYRGKCSLLAPCFHSKVELCSSPLFRPLNPVSSPSLCQRFYQRNHCRKRFENVYQSNNNHSQLSFDWD